MIPTEFLSYMVHIVNLSNPMFIITEGHYHAMDLCAEIQFAITCIEYSHQDLSSVLPLLLSRQNNRQKFNPIVLSDGNHKELIKALNTNPLVFSNNGLWFMPIDHMKLLNLRLDSKAFFYTGNLTNGYTLHESYSIQGGRPIKTKVDEWRPGYVNGQSRLALDIMERRSDLQGTVLRHSWFEDPPYVTYMRDKSGKVVDIVGYNAALLEELQGQMNFNITEIEATEPSWGSMNEDGSWSGIMGKFTICQGCAQYQN